MYINNRKESFKICVTIIQNQIETKVNALVDTGASISCINPQWAEKLKLEKLSMTVPMYVRLADGNFGKPNPVGETVDLEVVIGSRRTKLHCYLVEIGHDCIIGLDWLQANKPTLDWDNLTIGLASVNKEHVLPVEYSEFEDLFDKEKANVLPTHSRYDHSIELKPGTTPPMGPIYSMNQK